MKTGPSILVIDDEVQIRRLLDIALSSSDYDIIGAGSARDGLISAATLNPDLIILDLGLPDEDGQSVLVKLKEWYTRPVIILSVRNSEQDIVKALDNGATDYLTKPFRTGELLARVRSALRINQRETDPDPVLVFGPLSINSMGHIVKKNDEVVKLTSTEFSLLNLLARNSGKVLTHQHILKEVWGLGYVEQTQYLRVFIAQLRKKIEDDPTNPAFIITESGIGYRFQD